MLPEKMVWKNLYILGYAQLQTFRGILEFVFWKHIVY